eukprot:sb/3472863/
MGAGRPSQSAGCPRQKFAIAYVPLYASWAAGKVRNTAGICYIVGSVVGIGKRCTRDGIRQRFSMSRAGDTTARSENAALRTPGPTLAISLTNLSLSCSYLCLLTYHEFFLLLRPEVQCLSLLFSKFHNAILLCLFPLYLKSTIMSQILTLLDLAGSVKK